MTSPPTYSHIFNARLSSLRDRIPRRQQLRPTTRKHLATSLYTLHIIRRRQPFIRLEVFIEIEQIAAVTRCVGNGNETIHGRGTVRADDEVEFGGANCRRSGRGRWVAVVAERGDGTEVAEPDHDLVGLRTRAGGADEGVVGDVGADGGAGVAG